jgi:5-oxoprolinase (ATP-hydrolysing)
MGASAAGDGEANSTFPSSAASGSIEILEQRSPVWVKRRSLVVGSGGGGRNRGGAGEEVALALRPDDGRRMRVVTSLERMSTAPYGLEGGADGSRSELVRTGGAGGDESVVDRVIELAGGEGLVIRTAGGGGFGEPAAPQ